MAFISGVAPRRRRLILAEAGAVEDATNNISIIVRDRIWRHPARERARPGICVGLLFGPVGLP